MESKFIILGCGGHARSIADVILQNTPTAMIFFIDKNAKQGERLMNFPVLKFTAVEGNFVLGVGDNEKRRSLANGIKCYTVKSKTASVSNFSSLGEGCFIGHGAHIGPYAIIGTGSIVNTNTVVEHDVRVGEFCHIAPNSVICGRCHLGNSVFVGAGAVVKDNIHICSDVVIGAGAVVVNDIIESGTYVGIPAKKRKN